MFHSIEGGAIITNDPELTKKMSFLRNFGHSGPESFECVGINGKNSEFHAAMGLANIKYIDSILAKRKHDYEYYLERIKTLNVQFLKITPDTDFNYSYLPIVFENESQMLKIKQTLADNWIYCRRYFYPSLTALNYVGDQNTPISDDISKRIMCLPMFFDLSKEEIDFISRLMLRVQNN